MTTFRKSSEKQIEMLKFFQEETSKEVEKKNVKGQEVEGERETQKESENITDYMEYLKKLKHTIISKNNREKDRPLKVSFYSVII